MRQLEMPGAVGQLSHLDISLLGTRLPSWLALRFVYGIDVHNCLFRNTFDNAKIYVFTFKYVYLGCLIKL